MQKPEFDKPQLIELLKQKAVKHGEFILASGKKSNIYIDGRLITLSASGALSIADGILDYLQNFPDVQAVGGLTMGADPIVGAVLAQAPKWGRPDLAGFLVRKQSKDHGTGKLVEGPLAPGMKVAILDDVATTGGSSLQAIQAVHDFGATVALVIVVLDRLQGASAAFSVKGIHFKPLTTLKDLGIEPQTS